ncbi:MAG TPA: tRNA (adenosine(37)-N6)-threonylcarbamoyltransferase complex dimerization subunit type 1 TsaB [Thermoleophilaceae bacterium]|nr:tRNA (adenosine(37)-N6)-threonylcarbamoyltransferase complex dimerization subunit type 1 TsaB [Thermoleophilaceae bacterium]
MSLLGMDTSTAASAACVLRSDGEAFEVAPEPATLMARPAHARELMPAVAAVMERAGLDYADLEAIAVGVGPGTFTGLRIGVATARALANANGLEVRPVSSLAALAAGIQAEAGAVGRGADEPAAARSIAAEPAANEPAAADAAPWLLPVIDAKRGEVFTALYEPGGDPKWGPLALRPEELAEHAGAAAERLPAEGDTPADRAGEARHTLLAAGDGSVRFRGVLEAAGIRVMSDDSRAHVVRALHVCRLAAGVRGVPPQAVLPDYLRAPDAKPQ